MIPKLASTIFFRGAFVLFFFFTAFFRTECYFAGTVLISSSLFIYVLIGTGYSCLLPLVFALLNLLALFSLSFITHVKFPLATVFQFLHPVYVYLVDHDHD